MSTAEISSSKVDSTSSKERAWTFLKWNLMSAALFWLLVYRMSESAEKLPEFVYVNF